MFRVLQKINNSLINKTFTNKTLIPNLWLNFSDILPNNLKFYSTNEKDKNKKEDFDNSKKDEILIKIIQERIEKEKEEERKRKEEEENYKKLYEITPYLGTIGHLICGYYGYYLVGPAYCIYSLVGIGLSFHKKPNIRYTAALMSFLPYLAIIGFSFLVLGFESR